ncbi:uncharacterized protein LOC132907846 [Bombus pascuorum]|uniref:uncharacterized protein LOC132907846 n=1 Tax=Bombus pascuorum TaxID=65598 RepID=UPI00212CB27D|nr:uncharacterized protein LOC132907846 [Bombus pascuorum]
MSEFDDLKDAIACLNESVSNFPIGAISIEDFKPIEERITDTRALLKCLNAKLLILKAQHDFYTAAEEPVEDLKDTVTNLHEATASSLITNTAIKLCLHSHSIQAILEGKEGNSDMQRKIYAYMRKLFSLNDNILIVQKEIDNATKEQLELKIQCRNALFEHKKFLKEQEEICNKKLKEINPQLAINKEKTNRTIRNINIMKKLIVNFIAASNHMLYNDPFFVQMLEEHRELVNIETVLKISQSNFDNKEDKSS